MKTLTVKELRTILKSFPDSYKVYLSRDTEGNGFGTLEPKWSFAYNTDDKNLTLYPFDEYLDDEDISPKQSAKIDAELKAEQAERDRKKNESMESSTSSRTA